MLEPETSFSTQEDHALLKAAVRESGKLALSYYRKAKLKKWFKSEDAIVTEADIAVNNLLHERLALARPDYAWLSEETEDRPARLAKRRVWVIDPIDGTAAFANSIPHFTVSAALVEDGRPILAALFNPALDEFFEASVGQGAMLNGQPIRASERTELEGSRMVAFAPMFDHPSWPEKWPPMDFLDRNSVAYRIALVACGAADAAIALSPKNDWDIAAADLILWEAGGKLTSHTGEIFIYNRETPRHRSTIAAGPALYDAIMARVSKLELPPA